MSLNVGISGRRVLESVRGLVTQQLSQAVFFGSYIAKKASWRFKVPSVFPSHAIHPHRQC